MAHIYCLVHPPYWRWCIRRRPQAIVIADNESEARQVASHNGKSAENWEMYGTVALCLGTADESAVKGLVIICNQTRPPSPTYGSRYQQYVQKS